MQGAINSPTYKSICSVPSRLREFSTCWRTKSGAPLMPMCPGTNSLKIQPNFVATWYASLPPFSALPDSVKSMCKNLQWHPKANSSSWNVMCEEVCTLVLKLFLFKGSLHKVNKVKTRSFGTLTNSISLIPDPYLHIKTSAPCQRQWHGSNGRDQLEMLGGAGTTMGCQYQQWNTLSYTSAVSTKVIPRSRAFSRSSRFSFSAGTCWAFPYEFPKDL